MKNKIIISTLLLVAMLFISESAFAQRRTPSNQPTQKKEPTKNEAKEATGFASRLWYGGGVGLGLNNNSFNFGLSPMVGYKLTEKFSTGIRIPLSYDYFKATGTDNSVATYSNIDYGAGVFTRYKFFRNIFAHAEYDHLWSKTPATQNGFLILDPDNPGKLLKEKLQKDAFHLGLGYSSGDRIGYEIAILYNVLEDPESSNIPWSIRAGFNYKF